MKELSPWRIRRTPELEESQSDFSYAAQPDEVHLVDYWNILVKRRRIILTILLIGLAFGTYFPFSATKLFTATASIKIEPQHPQITGVGSLQPIDASQWGGQYDYYQTQFALLRSRRLAAQVIGDLKLESNNRFTNAQIRSPNPLDHIQSWIQSWIGTGAGYISRYVSPLLKSRSEPEKTDASAPQPVMSDTEIEMNVDRHLINRYLGYIRIAPIERTRLVRVQFTTPDPALSQLLANAHVETFLRTTLESRFSLTKEARAFLDQKIIELRQQLEKSEGALNQFRRKHGVLSVEKGENIAVDRLLELNRQLTAARAQRIEAESLHRTVANKQYQDLADVMREGIVPQLKSNVATLEAEKARISTVFRPDHPRFKELEHQIAAARQALNAEIANVVRTIQSNYAAALAKERALEAEAEKQQQDALKVNELGVQFTVLQGEVNADRTLYESVLKRLSETSVINDTAVSNVQIAERADRPLGPSEPKPSMYLLGSIVSSLFLGIGIAFAREYFDSRVATPEDVRRSVGLATLGVVPHLRHLTGGNGHGARVGPQNSGYALLPAQGSAKELIVNHNPISIINESYRAIRTALLLSQPDEPPQIVLLSSAAPSEGKTTTTLNLAIALANDGYSVLVIDGDMRKGCCHRRLGLRNNRGLSNVLTGNLSLQEGVQETSVPGLSLLSRGTIPPNPTELLGSRRMRESLHELRQTFKFILIDSPPVIAVSDAAVLSVLSDGVLLVFDGEKTSTPSAQKAVERLDIVRAKLLGVILNGVNLDHPHYSYFRSYSSYYAYEPATEDERDESLDVNFDGSYEYPGKSWTMDSEPNGDSEPNERNTGTLAGTCEAESIGTASSAASLKPRQSPTLPEASLNKLIRALTEAIGPVAALVVQEQISALGETATAFPKRRIPELLKSVQREITKEELIRFKANMPEEFREDNLSTQ